MQIIILNAINDLLTNYYDKNNLKELYENRQEQEKPAAPVVTDITGTSVTLQTVANALYSKDKKTLIRFPCGLNDAHSILDSLQTIAQRLRVHILRYSSRNIGTFVSKQIAMGR